MPKALCFIGMAVAAVMIVLFGLDLAVGFPFYGQNKLLDVTFVASAAILAYLSWATIREIER